MAELIRLDPSGHTKVAEWAAGDAAALERAQAAFANELERGMIASVSRGPGSAEHRPTWPHPVVRSSAGSSSGSIIAVIASSRGKATIATSSCG